MVESIPRVGVLAGLGLSITASLSLPSTPGFIERKGDGVHESQQRRREPDRAHQRRPDWRTDAPLRPEGFARDSAPSSASSHESPLTPPVAGHKGRTPALNERERRFVEFYMGEAAGNATPMSAETPRIPPSQASRGPA